MLRRTTRCPMRAAAGYGARVARSATSSMPTIKPRWRTSPTCASGAIVASRAAPSARAMRGDALERALVAEDVEDGEARRRRRADCRCRCGRGRSVRTSSYGAEEGLEDLLARERRGERQIAAGDALADAQEVGRDVRLLAGEHRPGAAEAGRDLVADQQHAVRVREPLASARRYAGGCVHMPAAPCTSGSTISAASSWPCAAQRRARASASAAARRRRRIMPALPAKDVRRRQAQRRANEQRPVEAVEGLASSRRRPRPACRRGTPRRATRSGCAASSPRSCQYWNAMLERDLDRGGAGVGVEDARQPGRRELDEARRELDGAGRSPGRAASSARRGRAGRAARRRGRGGDGRGRCTTATRRRRGSAGRATSIRWLPSAAAIDQRLARASQSRICVNGCQRCAVESAGGAARAARVGHGHQLRSRRRRRPRSPRSICAGVWVAIGVTRRRAVPAAPSADGSPARGCRAASSAAPKRERRVGCRRASPARCASRRRTSKPSRERGRRGAARRSSHSARRRSGSRRRSSIAAPAAATTAGGSAGRVDEAARAIHQQVDQRTRAGDVGARAAERLAERAHVDVDARGEPFRLREAGAARGRARRWRAPRRPSASCRSAPRARPDLRSGARSPSMLNTESVTISRRRVRRRRRQQALELHRVAMADRRAPWRATDGSRR